MRLITTVTTMAVLLTSKVAADDLSDLFVALALNDGRTISVETDNHTYEITWDDGERTFVVKKDSTAATDLIIVADVVPITFTAFSIGGTPEVSGSAKKTSASTLQLVLVVRPAANYIYNVTVSLDLTTPVSSEPVNIPESAFAEECKCVGAVDGCSILECDGYILCGNNKGRCKWVKTVVVDQ